MASRWRVSGTLLLCSPPSSQLSTRLGTFGQTLFFSCPGNSLPDLGHWVSECHFWILTQRVTFNTWDPSDIWSAWCPDKRTKKTKRQKSTELEYPPSSWDPAFLEPGLTHLVEYHGVWELLRCQTSDGQSLTILYSHSPIFASEEIGLVGQTDDAAWSERMRGSDLSSPGGEPAIRKFKNLKKSV